MKLINPKIHGILDYVVVAFLWSSALLFPFTPWVKSFTFVLGFVHLTLTMITDFPAGVIRILPLKIHGIVELVVSFLLIILPSILSLRGVDRTFYVIFGIAVFLTWALTDYKKQ